MTSRVLLSCGEASGDLYAGALTRALRARAPGLTVAGMGGPAFAAAGGERVEDFSELTVTGFTAIPGKLPRLRAAMARLVTDARAHPPAALVVIDFFGFNARLARRVKALGIPVVYYVSPQIWAWRRGRLATIKEIADKVLVIFPFEETIYKDAGVPVEFVGHPLIDFAAAAGSKPALRARLGLDADRPLVALLPGSRPSELRRILPDLVSAATRIAAQVDGVQFVLARAPNLPDALLRPALDANADVPAIQIVSGDTDGVLAAADVALTASGTATVQAALHDTPMVVVYRLSSLEYRIGKPFVSVDMYAMVNLIAGERVVPELIQDAFTPDAVAAEAVSMLTDEVRAGKIRAGLARVRATLGGPGASGRAADAILKVAGVRSYDCLSMPSVNSFKTQTTLQAGSKRVQYFSLKALEAAGFPEVARLPYSLKILLENLLRHEDGRFVKAGDIEALARWDVKSALLREISFAPARVLLQDFTGVPAVVDLAAMRDGIARLGGDPNKVNPLQPVELVIDHSVQVDYFGQADAFQLNAELEFSRNKERYAFLRWGQNAFRNFRVVPPDTGIVHQVNLEYLARVIVDGEAAAGFAYPDTLVGTDSHTTMVNGLGVVGWGVGGIEAEAAMLGQPISMLIPQVLGFRLTGAMLEGTTATDLVLTITERLRKHGVVGKFVEFFGPGLKDLTIADRATLGNMCPEYGATIAIFPIDAMTLDYLRLSARKADHVALVEAYAKAQGLFSEAGDPDPVYTECIELDLGTVEPSLAGPRRPQDRVSVKQAKAGFAAALGTLQAAMKKAPAAGAAVAVAEPPAAGQLENGSVVIAAITSCTNTSNPSVMIGAGLLAKKAVEKGLTRKPWVKTSLAPGSKVVTEYLHHAGLDTYLDRLGFNLVGYGCTTCIGNSGPLPDDVSAEVDAKNLVVASVLSGNRNFEGRIQQQVRANYLASPPLVVAYALTGKMTVDLTTEPLGTGSDGNPVFLRDIWPSEREIQETMLKSVNAEMFRSQYADVFSGDSRWQTLGVPTGDRFTWEPDSTYIRNPPFFDGLTMQPAALKDFTGARALAVLGDSITTDHISPAGSIKKDSPAGKYLMEHGVKPSDFNSYGARRGNHEVMMRGTFANVRLRNQLAPGTEGGWTAYQPEGDVMTIYDAAMKYKSAGVPLIILAGKEYGSGSSRDWAAKGTLLLGVRVVIAESFERIHRSNLVNMGVLPLVFPEGKTAASLGLTGKESFEIAGVADGLKPAGLVKVRAVGEKTIEFDAVARIDTPEELVAFKHGGILPYVLRQLVGIKG